MEPNWYPAVGESVDEPTLVSPNVASVSALERGAWGSASTATPSVTATSKRTTRPTQPSKLPGVVVGKLTVSGQCRLCAGTVTARSATGVQQVPRKGADPP